MLRHVKSCRPFLLSTWNYCQPIVLSVRNLVEDMSDTSISYEFGSTRPYHRHQSYSPLTIGQLLDRSTELDGDRTAVIVAHQNIKKTYGQFKTDVDRLSRSLQSIGCARGSLVGLWAVNCYEWLLVQFATAKLGAIMVAINPAYKERELLNSMRLVGIETLIMNQRFKSSNYYQMIENISPGLTKSAKEHQVHSEQLPTLKNLIVIDQLANEAELAPDNVCRFSQLMNRGQNLNLILEKDQITKFDDVINVQFTSGTTGLPKASMATHHNIIQNIQFTSQIVFEGFLKSGEDRPVICLPNPLFHAFGCVMGSTAAIYVHGTLVLPAPVFNTHLTLKAIEEFNCNYLYGTPTMWSDILHSESLKGFRLESLKRGLMSGAYCPPLLLNNLYRSIPSLEHILIPYGSTELGPVATATSVHDTQKHRLESVGRPIPMVEVKIIDLKSKRILPRGEKGEVCIRSHGTFPGYMNQPDKTKEVLDENFWYHTGDVGWMDDQGYLMISGRIKEMIIRGGENIYPREVEDLIMDMMKQVEDVHVVGVPDERLGEEMVAYVKMKQSVSDITEEQFKDDLKSKISHFKVPKYIKFVHDFPRTPTGKVRKVELKQMAIKEFSADNSN